MDARFGGPPGVLSCAANSVRERTAGRSGPVISIVRFHLRTEIQSRRVLRTSRGRHSHRGPRTALHHSTYLHLGRRTLSRTSTFTGTLHYVTKVMHPSRDHRKSKHVALGPGLRLKPHEDRVPLYGSYLSLPVDRTRNHALHASSHGRMEVPMDIRLDLLQPCTRHCTLQPRQRHRHVSHIRDESVCGATARGYTAQTRRPAARTT